MLSHEREFDLALSLDVIYHLVEDDVYENYMAQLFQASQRFVIIYSSNSDSVTTPTHVHHVRHREFTRWVAEERPDSWRLIKRIPNRYPFDESDPQNTSFSDFYIFERIGHERKD